MTMEIPERLLTPGEVALIFKVDPKTVTRWASAGRIRSIRTPGGHHRFRESDVNNLLTDTPSPIPRPVKTASATSVTVRHVRL